MGELALDKGDVPSAVEHFAAAINYSNDKVKIIQHFENQLPRDIFYILMKYLSTVAEVCIHYKLRAER